GIQALQGAHDLAAQRISTDLVTRVGALFQQHHIYSLLRGSQGGGATTRTATEYADLRAEIRCHDGSAPEGGRCELIEETHVVLPVHTQIGNAVDELCDTLHAHAEGEAAVHFRIDTTVGEHRRIHHAATHDLHPTAVFAEVAA